MEDWHGEKYRYHAPFSFIITNIEGENIEGDYSNFSPFIYVTEPGIRYPTYTGIVKGETAKCTLYDSDNKPKDAGTLELTFLDSRRIEGKFMEEGKVQWKYVFRPYTLNDIKGLHITKRFQEEVDTWGEISVAVGTVEYQSVGGSHFTAPALYIINESDDILYEFPIGSQAASEFYEMDVADYNGNVCGGNFMQEITHYSEARNVE